MKNKKPSFLSAPKTSATIDGLISELNVLLSLINTEKMTTHVAEKKIDSIPAKYKKLI